MNLKKLSLFILIVCQFATKLNTFPFRIPFGHYGKTPESNESSIEQFYKKNPPLANIIIASIPIISFIAGYLRGYNDGRHHVSMNGEINKNNGN